MEAATTDNKIHALQPAVAPPIVDETSRPDILPSKPDIATNEYDSLDGHYNRDRDRNRDSEDHYMRSHSRDLYDTDYDRSDKHRKNRKYDRDKKHHYHRKSSDRDRDHHRSHRDRYRYRDDERDSSRDSSKYRDSYKLKSDRDRDYSKSMGKSELNFGSSGYTNSAAASYDQAYSYQSMTSSYGSQPPLPPQSSTDYSYSSVPASATWNHPHPWQSSIAPIPPDDPWSSRSIIPPPPANDVEEDWDNDDASKSTTATKRDDEKSSKKMEDEDQSTIDLDTRIAMMFKEKSFGAAPPFLQMEDSDPEVDHKEDGEIRSDDAKVRSKARAHRARSKSSHSSKSSDSKRLRKQNRLRTQVDYYLLLKIFPYLCARLIFLAGETASR